MAPLALVEVDCAPFQPSERQSRPTTSPCCEMVLLVLANAARTNPLSGREGYRDPESRSFGRTDDDLAVTPAAADACLGMTPHGSQHLDQRAPQPPMSLSEDRSFGELEEPGASD